MEQSVEPDKDNIVPEGSEANKLKHSFFNSKHEKGNLYFKNSKVGSCSYVLVKNGQSLAMPFGIKNQRGRSLNHFKTVPQKLLERKSTYMHDYIQVGNMHCGMDKKPLVPYDPESYRNRLPVNGIVSGAAINRSYLDLGNCNLINRKQWKTTYRDSFRSPRIVPVSNLGIAADMAKASHMLLNS